MIFNLMHNNYDTVHKIDAEESNTPRITLCLLLSILNPLDPTDFHSTCGISPGFSENFPNFQANFGHVYKFKVIQRCRHLQYRPNFFCVE